MLERTANNFTRVLVLYHYLAYLVVPFLIIQYFCRQPAWLKYQLNTNRGLCCRNLTPDLQDAVLTLVTNANILMKSKQGMSVGGGSVGGLGMPGGAGPAVLRGAGMQPPIHGLPGMAGNMNSQVHSILLY